MLRLLICLKIGLSCFRNGFKIAWNLKPRVGDTVNINFTWNIVDDKI